MLRVFRLLHDYQQPREKNVPEAVRRELNRFDLRQVAGKTVAITAGSRGIPNIVSILSTTVENLRQAGASPFVVPAMGSHGGATASGQIEILADYGITEESVACPIRGDLDTVKIGQEEGGPLLWSRLLCEADFVLVVNRVKCHTKFVGTIESGLCKMIAIGGGRYEGAKQVHRRAKVLGMEQAIFDVTQCVLDQGRLLGGLAILDNAEKDTAFIRAVTLDGFIEQEQALLEQAKALLPQLPFSTLDVVYLQQMGKNVSGTGADPNVIGRGMNGSWRLRELPREGQAEIGSLLISSLTPESRGNAVGIAFADAVAARLAKAVDWSRTRINAETGQALDLIEEPPVFPNDREMLAAALRGVQRDSTGPLVVLAKNTSELRVLYATEGLYEHVAERSDLDILDEPRELRFDESDHLILEFNE